MAEQRERRSMKLQVIGDTLGCTPRGASIVSHADIAWHATEPAIPAILGEYDTPAGLPCDLSSPRNLPHGEVRVPMESEQHTAWCDIGLEDEREQWLSVSRGVINATHVGRTRRTFTRRLVRNALLTPPDSADHDECQHERTDQHERERRQHASSHTAIEPGFRLIIGEVQFTRMRLPIDTFRLPNGLFVTLSEDHTAPIVAVNLWYHVGSANERTGRTGFAHLFEHMLFQGSANVAANEHFELIQRAGGTLNGSTWLDRTNYYETVPSNQLAIALWLEADRMGRLLPAMTQQKLDTQRDVVKNERRCSPRWPFLRHTRSIIR